MPARRAVPAARFAVSCRESEWERIREIAARRGQTINRYMIGAALNVDPDPAPETPALALSEDEQRRLLETVERLADGMLAEAGPGAGEIANLRQSVGLLLAAMLRDLVRQGRDDELGSLTTAVFGDQDGPEFERRLRAWVERNPPDG